MSFYDFLFQKSVLPLSIHLSVFCQGNIRVCLRATALCAALRPAGPVLCQCQISTHVWSSSDMSSIYPSATIFSHSLFLLCFSPSLPYFSVFPCFSLIVVFFICCLFLLREITSFSQAGADISFLNHCGSQLFYCSSLFHSLFLQCTERQTQQMIAETQGAC